LNIEFKRKGLKTTLVKQNGEVVWLTHKIFESFPEINMAYSTRLGGVSTGVCSFMNLRNCEWDTEDNYRKNLQIFCDAAGFNFEKIAATAQTHTTNIAVVREGDAPKGTLFKSKYTDIDGLVTNAVGITLVTSFADCIPVFIYDPVHKAIASCHSGWKGTLGRISAAALTVMEKEYGTKACDVIAGIGPGICADCYEVSDDLYEAFSADRKPEQLGRIFLPGRPGHYQMDLLAANRFVLLDAGVKPENISVSDICTKCNSDLLFSHRAMGNKRGNQCGFMMIK